MFLILFNAFILEQLCGRRGRCLRQLCCRPAIVSKLHEEALLRNESHKFKVDVKTFALTGKSADGEGVALGRRLVRMGNG